MTHSVPPIILILLGGHTRQYRRSPTNYRWIIKVELLYRNTCNKITELALQDPRRNATEWNTPVIELAFVGLDPGSHPGIDTLSFVVGTSRLMEYLMAVPNVKLYIEA